MGTNPYEIRAPEHPSMISGASMLDRSGIPSPPHAQGDAESQLNRLLRANAPDQVKNSGNAYQMSFEGLNHQVQTMQGTLKMIMEKLQQFELKHRGDISNVRTEMQHFATNVTNQGMKMTSNHDAL
jgi:hypothetical protein